MTHSVKTVFALLIVFSAFFVKAEPTISAACEVIEETEANHYRVIYRAPIKSKVTIRVFDNSNNVLYTETEKSVSGFIKKFDFSNLKDGEYRFEVKADGYLFNEVIEIGSTPEGLNYILAPYSGREVVFAVNNLEARDMSLYILDDADNVIYKDLFEQTQAIKKLYNFKKLNSNQVTFVLYHKDQLITEKEFKF